MYAFLYSNLVSILIGCDTLGTKNKVNIAELATEGKQPGKKKDTVPKFTHKEITTVAQHVEVLDWLCDNPSKSQTQAAAHFDTIYPNLQLKQPTISPWVKEEKKWCDRYAEEGGIS